MCKYCDWSSALTLTKEIEKMIPDAEKVQDVAAHARTNARVQRAIIRNSCVTDNKWEQLEKIRDSLVDITGYRISPE